jgi:hypothetical protein
VKGLGVGWLVGDNLSSDPLARSARCGCFTGWASRTFQYVCVYGDDMPGTGTHLAPIPTPTLTLLSYPPLEPPNLVSRRSVFTRLAQRFGYLRLPILRVLLCSFRLNWQPRIPRPLRLGAPCVFRRVLSSPLDPSSTTCDASLNHESSFLAALPEARLTGRVEMHL